MKKVLLLICLLSFLPAYPASINNAVYQTMRASSYRNNYNRQVNNRVVPYWQSQANYATRNRIHMNYSNYNNKLYNYTNTRNSYRGYR